MARCWLASCCPVCAVSGPGAIVAYGRGRRGTVSGPGILTAVPGPPSGGPVCAEKLVAQLPVVLARRRGPHCDTTVPAARLAKRPAVGKSRRGSARKGTRPRTCRRLRCCPPRRPVHGDRAAFPDRRSSRAPREPRVIAKRSGPSHAPPPRLVEIAGAGPAQGFGVVGKHQIHAVADIAPGTARESARPSPDRRSSGRWGHPLPGDFTGPHRGGKAGCRRLTRYPSM
jgi:hypothetical protein